MWRNSEKRNFWDTEYKLWYRRSANIRYENRIREYLNFRVILSYTIYMLILLLNTWCYTKVDMRYGPVIDTAAYVFVLLLSHFILKEKITKGKIMGNLIIIAGIPLLDLVRQFIEASGMTILLFPSASLKRYCTLSE